MARFAAAVAWQTTARSAAHAAVWVTASLFALMMSALAEGRNMANLHAKYELLAEDTISVEGRILFRVRRIQDHKLGGYIESELNLSQQGGSFLAEEARAYGTSRVLDDAQLDGIIRGAAVLQGRARLNGEAWGDAVIEGDAVVSGKAYETSTVRGHARVFGEVFGAAVVEGHATIFGRAFGNARVGGYDVVFGDRDS